MSEVDDAAPSSANEISAYSQEEGRRVEMGKERGLPLLVVSGVGVGVGVVGCMVGRWSSVDRW